ncbi:hypothetical protein LGK97_07910 [Clostridium sp. CS001]|uniref:CD3072 family TudS-related putative desulfidase n=1 Tax=Clostridium sp. CS001 TaxID=2880648 RepID=UPI001CF26E1C|nr:CD3072 family TudS-related putative desulfidase [Clostridium sp. CS001]MCB2289687.1 hypothetical protein [Clostridium sp. CS001]
MQRKKEMVLLCHCIVNCNSKVEGLALYKGAQVDLIKYLIEKGYGIIQLPCPEMSMYGIKRWGQVKEQFDTPYYRNNCKKILEPILEQVLDYTRNGYSINALIGVDGSPSCGVNKTCSSSLWGGEIGFEYGIEKKIKNVITINAKGVFIEELDMLLAQNNIKIKFIAIDESNPNSSIEYIINSLEGDY